MAFLLDLTIGIRLLAVVTGIILDTCTLSYEEPIYFLYLNPHSSFLLVPQWSNLGCGILLALPPKMEMGADV
jgi:hypothetical protein